MTSQRDTVSRAHPDFAKTSGRFDLLGWSPNPSALRDDDQGPSLSPPRDVEWGRGCDSTTPSLLSLLLAVPELPWPLHWSEWSLLGSQVLGAPAESQGICWSIRPWWRPETSWGGGGAGTQTASVGLGGPQTVASANKQQQARGRACLCLSWLVLMRLLQPPPNPSPS